jgi:hypothetical protein
MAAGAAVYAITQNRACDPSVWPWPGSGAAAEGCIRADTHTRLAADLPSTTRGGGPAPSALVRAALGARSGEASRPRARGPRQGPRAAGALRAALSYAPPTRGDVRAASALAMSFCALAVIARPSATSLSARGATCRTHCTARASHAAAASGATESAYPCWMANRMTTWVGWGGGGVGVGAGLCGCAARRLLRQMGPRRAWPGEPQA